MDEKRYGRQEPTVRFTLPYQKSIGSEAIELYEKTKRIALDWQKALIEDMMAIDNDGLYIHSRFGYSVPRQNGKNEVIAIREMYGLTHGDMILHTAHRTSTSGAAWMRLVKLLEAAGIKEKKGDVKVGYRSGKSKGQEFIELDEEVGGGRINFRTRTTTGGLGETYDLLVIDEAQEYQDDQESALKYTIVSRPNPQTILLGTPPTVYSSGTLFPKFRKDTLCGQKKHAGWAEWSVDEQTDINTVDAWYETNPSLGYTLTERAIEDELGDDAVDFNVQRLGLWISYNQKSEISRREWEELQVQTPPACDGKICIGIKFGKDGGNVAMAGAYTTTDGETFTEVIGCKPIREGTDWIIAFLNRANGNYCKVVSDGANGQALMEKALKDAKLKPAHYPTVREFIDANADFEQLLSSKTLKHCEQPAVTQTITNCEKRPIGSGGGFGYKSIKIGADIVLMDSMILATWGLKAFKKTKSSQKIVY